MTIFEELKQLRTYTNASPELIRECVGIIKELGSEKFKIPAYQLPADSFIEWAVLKVLNKASLEYSSKEWN